MAKTIKTSKTTQQNLDQLLGILRHIKRAKEYIGKESTVVCKRSSGTTTLDYHNAKADDYIYPVNKDHGSDLCGIDFAFDQLERFIINAS